MIEFHLTVSADYVDDITDALENFGAIAITLQDAANQPIYEPKPGEIIQWQVMNLTALFNSDVLLQDISAYLDSLLAKKILQRVEMNPLREKNWIEACQEHAKPTRFGKRLWVSPTWNVCHEANGVHVLFDPGVAFGTGSHPTTALCLEWLDENIKGGEVVVDYGCGSGILAIAALKLGAKSAIAIDYDPQALYATKMNAELNEISPDVLNCRVPDRIESLQVDLVVANIISSTLIDLASTFEAIIKPNGRLVLSGVLDSQLAELTRAYSESFTVTHIATKDEWMRVELAYSSSKSSKSACPRM